jgi:outer membrane biosynthesis protein TonB
VALIGCRLPDENIQHIVREQAPRIRDCYARALPRNPGLRGRVAVRFVIGQDGAVIFADLGSSDLPDGDVIRCVVDVVRTLRGFHGATRNATVVYPFSFTPGGGTRSAHEVQRVLDDARPRFRICYERALELDPSLEGAVRLRFVVGATGDVVAASAERSTLDDREAVACIVHMLEGVSFSPSEAGDLAVVHSLTFRR